MRRWLLLLALLPLGAFAQLQVSLYDGSAEKALTGATDVGRTAMGDATDLRFHARNSTNASIALQSLTVAGASFSISVKPTLPYIVAPANFVEFRVRFAPLAPGSYSATLAVNGASSILLATAYAAPVISVIADGPASVLAAGAPIDFGRILKNTSAARTIRIANSTGASLIVSTVTITGATFHLPSPPAMPATITAGSNVEFPLTFDPKSSGQQSGTLSVDGRSFALAGVAYDPPFPKPSILISGDTGSGAQPKLAIQFAEVSQVSGSGTLTLEFKPGVEGVTDDPAIVFLNSGSRKLSFHVAEGDAAASFDGLSQIPLQTGTTAGTITFTLQLADYTGQSTVVIPPAPVVIDTAAATRRVSDIDVSMTAFDNTRTSGLLRFTFYDRSGTVVAPGAIQVDVKADFGRYFAISKVGGSFLTRATFPVTGDATQIGGVEVELVNSAGTVRTARLNLQ